MYMAKKHYQDVIVTIYNDTTNPNFTLYNVYIISDKIFEFDTLLEVDIMDFYGNVSFTKQMNVSVSPQSSTIVYSLFTQAGSIDINNTLIRARITYNFGEGSSEKVYFMVRPLYLNLPQPTLQVFASDLSGEFQIQSNVVAHSVNVYFNGTGAQWSDNYFDLIPNEPKTISFRTWASEEKLGFENLVFNTLANAVTNTQPQVLFVTVA